MSPIIDTAINATTVFHNKALKGTPENHTNKVADIIKHGEQDKFRDGNYAV